MNRIFHTLCQLSSLMHLIILLNLDPSSLFLPGWLGITYHHCNINFITMNTTHVSTRYLYLCPKPDPRCIGIGICFPPKKTKWIFPSFHLWSPQVWIHETSRQIAMMIPKLELRSFFWGWKFPLLNHHWKEWPTGRKWSLEWSYPATGVEIRPNLPEKLHQTWVQIGTPPRQKAVYPPWN